ncbi:MAG: 2-oxoacid:acceptor oxidoreductase family protein [Chitinispirillia bacterium]|nr:2-oxoacid:acceptor oxidoreductase family protein [Chitinispirillia bacterium]MCL2269674.1 2-oxoacid:acceptor oxidoreductase family protein [Chitinispirillia bacterium]
MKKSNLDIRMAGLGGQGVVTAAHILGTAVVAAGKYAVVNPFFGAEKRLAPTESYVRISAEKIYDRGEVMYPNIIMVFAPQVITVGKSHTLPFYAGLREGGMILVNSAEPIISEKDRAAIDNLGVKVAYVPATKLAVDFTGTDLSMNMTMLGALCGMDDTLVDLNAVMTAVDERFSGKTKIVASGTSAALDDAIKSKFEKMGAMIEKNRTAINKAYEYAKNC